MNKYLYIFSYRTPEENGRLSSNNNLGKHTLALFIQAKSEQEALVWGREISEEFTHRLFGNSNTSWKEMKLPHCIADPSFLGSPSEDVRHIPVVPCGKYPDFSVMKARETDKE